MWQIIQQILNKKWEKPVYNSPDYPWLDYTRVDIISIIWLWII